MSEDRFDLPLDKLCEYACVVYLAGMREVGHLDRAEGDQWVVKAGWESVCALVNDLPDGDYSVADVSAQVREEYLRTVEIHDAPLLPYEPIVWEAVCRALFEVIEEGELGPDHEATGWVLWIREKLTKAGVVSYGRAAECAAGSQVPAGV